MAAFRHQHSSLKNISNREAWWLRFARRGIHLAGMARRAPNILITGTPGTGKTTLASQVAAATGLKHFNIGDLVKAEQLHNGWDEEFECLVIDEDKVRAAAAGAGRRRQRCRQPRSSCAQQTPLECFELSRYSLLLLLCKAMP